MDYDFLFYPPREEYDYGRKRSSFSSNRKKLRKYRDLPALWMREPDRYPHVLEVFRSFANKIVLFHETLQYKTFLMTGTDAKVGTSTVTFNLGLILGRSMPDRQILIIDAHLERPTLHFAFNHAPSNGLMKYLLGRSPLVDIVRPTFLPNLDIITFSHLEDEILSPFSLPSFKQLLDEVREYYDIVLLDSAPALKSSHTWMLSAKVDGVILVAQANRSRFEVLEELVQQLNIQEANLLGSFLNKRKYFIPQWIYRYIF
ncbi:MAG: CpsD/CapB family tyrosine-protein kinase [Candidatus Electrothrix scaldis]|nr:MAG: CpsD/CapB family tyrosine-protein kinase [Candidatus Electrothrix sp. GW3-3]